MKPADLYLGVSEVFSVLIPGFLVSTVATYMYFFTIGENGNLDIFSEKIAPLLWIILGIISYITGHVLFALGSKWDGLYDKYKPKGNEQLLDVIGEIREENYSMLDCESINKYKWCKSFLASSHPDGYLV